MRSRLKMCSKDELIDIVKRCTSLRDILRFFGYCGSGANANFLKEKLMLEEIDFQNLFKKKENIFDPNKVFIEHSRCDKSTVRRYILRDKLIEYKCNICGLLPFWCGKELTLILDHKNGNNRDNRLENLRFVCGNCEMQLKTHGSKNKIKIISKARFCIECNSIITRSSKFGICKKCSSKRSVLRKDGWPPTKEFLEVLIWKKPTTQIACDFGVSDKAITKWCRKFGLSKPGPGYWMKKIDGGCSSIG